MCVKCLDDVIRVYSENRRLYVATIELCTTCNWNCRYCYLPDHNEVGLSVEVLKDVLVQLREMGCFDLAFTGGELFTRSDALTVIKYARRLGFSVTLMTNLSMVSHEQLDTLKAINVEQIECTLFSLDPQLHDSFVQREGAFSKVYDNLFYCKKIGLNVCAAFAALNFNFDEVGIFSQFCEKYGIGQKYDFRVFPRLNHDKEPLRYALSGEHLSECIRILDKLKGVEYAPKGRQYLCGSTHTSLVVTAFGDVKLCALLDISLGNVKTDSISDILKIKKNIVDEIRNLKWCDLKSECKYCPDNMYCIRCPGIALLEGQPMDGKSPINCKYAKARKIASEGKVHETHSVKD